MRRRRPAVRAVFDRLLHSGAWVPSLWRLEIANSLCIVARRGRVTDAFRDNSLADLDLLPIGIDPETDRRCDSTFGGGVLQSEPRMV